MERVTSWVSKIRQLEYGVKEASHVSTTSPILGRKESSDITPFVGLTRTPYSKLRLSGRGRVEPKSASRSGSTGRFIYLPPYPRTIAPLDGVHGGHLVGTGSFANMLAWVPSANSPTPPRALSTPSRPRLSRPHELLILILPT